MLSIFRITLLAGNTGLFLLSTAANASAQSARQHHDPSRVPGSYTVAQSGRPLADMLLQLQQAFLSPINYEEVPYENDSELRSLVVSTLQGPKRLRFTPAADFTATLTEADSNPYLALHSVFAQYKQAGLYATDCYKIVQQENYVDVLPTQVLAITGSKRQVSPVMEHPVTFSKSERTGEQTLELLVREISKVSRKQVRLMWDPFTVLDPKVSVGADAELPSQILAKIGKSAGVTLSYQCLYDASDATYYVNFYPVAGKVEGTLYNDRAPGE
jgi:hypothetical protein